jgi:hypothetical protein
MNPVAAVGLFLLGGALAALLPRPLQEDRRATSGFKKHKRAVKGTKTQAGGGGRGGAVDKK